MAAPRSARHGAPNDHLRIRHVAKAAVSVIAALLSVSILVAFAYGWHYYGDLSSGLHKLKIDALGKKPTAAAGVTLHGDGKDENILITGLDDRSGLTAQQIKDYHTGDDVTTSTDSIMVVHVPADGSKATMISIPRDTIVDIPDYLPNKINAAYADGSIVGGSGTALERRAEGIDLLVKTVSQLTGLTINHFVEVGFSGFVNISDAIHGVKVDLCYAQNDPYSGLHVPAGPQRLEGAQALAFVRQRHNITGGTDSDLTRAQRQRYFLAAAFKQVVSIGVLTSPSKLSHLISAVRDSIFTDTDFNLVDLADQMANLTAGNILGYTIPTDGTYTLQRTNATPVTGFKVDPAEVQSKIQQVLYPPKATAPSSSSSGSSASSSPTSSPTPTKALSSGCIH